MMEQQDLSSGREFHLRDYLHVILKRKWIVVAFFVVVVVTVAISTVSEKPIYQATCQVLVERQNPKVVKIQEVVQLDSWWLDYYQTQCEILKSKRIVQAVINDLNLERDPRFNPALQEKRFSFNLSPKNATATVIRGINRAVSDSTNKKKDPGAPDPENALVSSYLGMLRVQHIEDSRLININFVSRDPELSALLANAHAKQYIKQSLEIKFATTKDAVDWLKQKIKETKTDLKESEEVLQRYKKENDMVSIDFGQASNIIIQKLNDLNSALTEAKTARIEKENLYEELVRISKKPGMVESIPAVVNNEFIRELKREYVRLQGQFSDMSQKYGAQHPQMKRLQSQIQKINSKIAQEIRKTAQSIETEYHIALAKEKALLKAVEDQKREALKLNQKEIQYNVLKRDVDTNRSMYESLLTRLKEATITEELKLTNISIVDPARIPQRPLGPDKRKNLMMAVIVGLMGGIGLAFFFEYLDGSIKNSEEIEKQLGLPFLGHVANMRSHDSVPDGERLIALRYPKSHAAEEFRTVSTNILYSLPDSPTKVLLVTSAVAEEGKTMLAVNLAIVLAQVGKRVLLIDADLRKPNIHTALKLKRAPGLADFLAQDVPPSSIFQSTPLKGLYIVSAGTASPNPVELLLSKKMAFLIENVREKLDFIIIDSPPLMMLSDSLGLAPIVDGTVMVIKSGNTPRQTVQKVLHQLAQVKGKIIGAVLNEHDVKRESYYYHYHYRNYYHRYYGQQRERGRQLRA